MIHLPNALEGQIGVKPEGTASVNALFTGTYCEALLPDSIRKLQADAYIQVPSSFPFIIYRHQIAGWGWADCLSGCLGTADTQTNVNPKNATLVHVNT